MRGEERQIEQKTGILYGREGQVRRRGGRGGEGTGIEGSI